MENRKSGAVALLDKFLSHEAGHFVQFIKYGIAGGVATVLDVIFFQLAGWLIWPCLRKDDLLVRFLQIDVPAVTDSRRAVNAMLSSLLAFTIANFVCYILNVRFVFKPGRHHWLVEIGLFYAVSGVSIILGTILMGWLISHFGMRTDFAFSANLVMSLMINYAMRKFVIFKG